MNFAEVLAAALVLACAAGGSLHIWASTAEAMRTAAQRRDQLLELDRAFLAAEAWLQSPDDPSVSPLPTDSTDCTAMSAWMASALSKLPLQSEIQPEVVPQGSGVLLRLQVGDQPARQRFLEPTAMKLCADEEPGAEAGGSGDETTS